MAARRRSPKHPRTRDQVKSTEELLSEKIALILQWEGNVAPSKRFDVTAAIMRAVAVAHNTDKVADAREALLDAESELWNATEKYSAALSDKGDAS